MYNSDTLYKKTSGGAVQIWRCWTEGPNILSEFGQQDGKIQRTSKKCTPKNVGRANATTAEQQADLEAAAMFKAKLTGHNYTRSAKDALAGKSDALVAGGLLPMLAHKYAERADNLVFPCFFQPKLDGHRCIAMPDGLWSRTRKLIPGLPHIHRAYMRLDGKLPWDGELYNHAYHDRFGELSHFIKQAAPIDGSEVVQYHVYDLPMSGTFRSRLAMMRLILHKAEHPIVLVKTTEVNNEDELLEAFNEALADGYEGGIARNADGLYVNTRSADLLKIKSMDDSEFKILDVVHGTGRMENCGIFVCQSPPKAKKPTFRAVMKCTLPERARIYRDANALIGRMLTVQHQGYGTDGRPRFPVALRVREDV